MNTVMNRKFIKYILCGAMAMVSLASCDDFLDTTNERETPAYNELTSYDALKATTANLYAAPWYYFHKRRFVQLGDARANNFYISDGASNDNNAQGTFNEVVENTSLTHAWASLYNVVTQAAYIIDDYAPYCVSHGVCTQEEANVCIGEARFMRALAYWYLATYWHDVPIVENATEVNTLTYANRFEDVMLYAISEAEYASKWLPKKPYQTGRVSKMTAQALLSRLYNTMAAFAQGEHLTVEFKTNVLDPYYADDADYTSGMASSTFFYKKAVDAAKCVIADADAAGYGLLDDYEQIFRVQNNNCKEVLFALQFVPGSTTYGLCNDIQGNFCYDNCLDNRYGQAYSTWASYDFAYVASHRGGLNRTRGNIMPSGMTYDYLYHEYDTCSVKGTVWTVAANRTYLPIKKQVVGGPMATDNVANNSNSGFDTPMIRMSEVYLNLAEALMGYKGVEETSDEEILNNINVVRRRAYKYEIDHDCYKGDYTVINRDSLLQERRMEFFMEDLSWADIVRRSFMGKKDLQHMIDYCNNDLLALEGDSIMGCHRMYKYEYKMNDDLNVIGTVKLSESHGQNVIVRQSRQCVHSISEGSYCHTDAVGEGDNLWSMIYPPAETNKDANLKKAPVAFDFTKILRNIQQYHQ